MYGESGTVSGRVWISSDPVTANEMPPLKHNALCAINKQFIHIMERWDSHMQVTMDDAQRKMRRANKGDRRRAEIGC